MNEQLYLCKHYWILESPAGATSQGTCRYCGATKPFRNSFEGMLPMAYTLSNLKENRQRWTVGYNAEYALESMRPRHLQHLK